MALYKVNFKQKIGKEYYNHLVYVPAISARRALKEVKNRGDKRIIVKIIRVKDTTLGY